MVSIPIYHAGEPSSIPGNGAVSAANAMSFTSGLLQMIPHSYMPNALFVAPDALTVSNPYRVQWVVRKAGCILLWSRPNAPVYCCPYTDEFPRELVTTSGLIFQIWSMLQIRITMDTFDTRMSL